MVGSGDSTNASIPFDTAADRAFCDAGDVAIGGFFNIISGSMGSGRIGDIGILQACTSSPFNNSFISIQTSNPGSLQTIRNCSELF